MISADWRLLAMLCFFVVHAVPAAEVTPEQIKTALPELEKFVEATLKKTGAPGMAIVVVHKDQVVFVKGFGVRQAGKDEPVDGDTVFQLASLSKPMASTVLAALVGEGVVAWDDRMIDRDPDFRLFDSWVTREVTLRDLLCHRGGLPDHGGDLLEDLGYERRAVLQRLRYLKPASSLRSHFAYTNFGFTAAAVAAARAAGKSWEDLAAEKLYRPLDMKVTSSRFEDYASAKNRAVAHVRVDGKWIAKYVRNADAQSPAGGVCSSARDLGQWMRLQLGRGTLAGKQIIAAKALGETHRPQIVSRSAEKPDFDRSGFYGLGWNVGYDDKGRVRLGHSGGFELGAATVVVLIPSEELGIAVLTNVAPIGLPEAVAESFLDLALKGKIERDWVELFERVFREKFVADYGTIVDYRKPPAKQAPPLPRESYLGVYGNDYFGDIDIGEKDEALVLRMGPKKTSFLLRHWDRDVFVYQPAGEMAGGPSSVTFSVGPDRKGRQVVVENLDVHGQGTFTRAVDGK